MHFIEEKNKTTCRRRCSRRCYGTNCTRRRSCRRRCCRLRLRGESCRSSCTLYNAHRVLFSLHSKVLLNDCFVFTRTSRAILYILILVAVCNNTQHNQCRRQATDNKFNM